MFAIRLFLQRACFYSLHFIFTHHIVLTFISLFLQRVVLALSAGTTKEQSALLESSGNSNTTDAEDENTRKLYRWKNLLPYFASIKSCAKTVSTFLKCMKVCVLRLKYSSIGEFLSKWGQTSFWFKKTCPEVAVFKTAFVKELYDGFVLKYSGEFHRVYENLKKYLEVSWLLFAWLCVLNGGFWMVLFYCTVGQFVIAVSVVYFGSVYPKQCTKK